MAGGLSFGLGPLGNYTQPGVYPFTIIEEDRVALTQGIRVPVMIGPAEELVSVNGFELFRGSSAQADNEVFEEDLSSQIAPANRDFQLANYPVVSGDGTGTVTNDPTKVKVLLNGESVAVTNLNGTTGEIRLAAIPLTGDTLVTSYFYNRTDTLIVDEDLSNQADGTNITFKTKSKPIVVGNNGGQTTNDVTNIEVKVNSVPVTVDALIGLQGVVELAVAPGSGDTVEITYYTNQYQNTFDLLPADFVETTAVGLSPGAIDFVQGVDYVVLGNKIYWGDFAVVTATEQGTLSGTDPFDDQKIQISQIDDWVANEYVGSGDGVATSFTLSRIPTDGSGLDIPTDNPSDITVRVGVDFSTAIASVPVTVKTLNSTTRQFTLAVAPTLGDVVLVSYFHNDLEDEIYTLEVTTVGGTGVGKYTAVDGGGGVVRDINEGVHSVAAANFAIEGITWPFGGQDDLRTISPNTPEETVTVTFQDALNYIVTSSRTAAQVTADGFGRTGNATTGVPGDIVAASAAMINGADTVTAVAARAGDDGNLFRVDLVDPGVPSAALSSVRTGNILTVSLATTAPVGATLPLNDPGAAVRGFTVAAVTPGAAGNLINLVIPAPTGNPLAVSLVGNTITLTDWDAAVDTSVAVAGAIALAAPGLVSTIVDPNGVPGDLFAALLAAIPQTTPATLFLSAGDDGGAISTTSALLAGEITTGFTPDVTASVTAGPGTEVVTAGSFQLAGGNPRNGSLGKSFEDPITGVRFTIELPTSFAYIATDTLVFDIISDFTAGSDAKRSFLGLSTVISNTTGTAIGNQGLIQTYDKDGEEPAIGDFYYYSGRYEKTNFDLVVRSKIQDVIREFGDYSINNKLVVMFDLAQRNGSPLIGLKQVLKAADSDDGSDVAYINALKDLEEPERQRVNIKDIVPFRTTDAVQAETRRHVIKMSSQRFRRNRRAILGTSVGTTQAEVKALAQGLNSELIQVIYPDSAILPIIDPLGREVEELVDGGIIAAAYAGKDLSQEFDVADSMTNKQIVGFSRLGRFLDDIEANELAVAGVTILSERDPLIVVRHDLTTNMSTILTQQPSVTKIAHFVEEAEEDALEPFIGRKGTDDILQDIEDAAVGALRALERANIIKAIGRIQVAFDSSDPRIVNITIQYSPTLPIIWITVENRIALSV